jgi:hypothetical protein
MIGRHRLSELRARSVEWHRRGISHPDEIGAMVHQRVHGNLPPEPSYGNFFRAA